MIAAKRTPCTKSGAVTAKWKLISLKVNQFVVPVDSPLSGTTPTPPTMPPAIDRRGDVLGAGPHLRGECGIAGVEDADDLEVGAAGHELVAEAAVAEARRDGPAHGQLAASEHVPAAFDEPGHGTERAPGRAE